MRWRTVRMAWLLALWMWAPPPGYSQAAPLVGAIVHAASYTPRVVAPGEIFTIFGSGLGTAEDTRVLFGGTEAVLLFVSQAQINGIVPSSLDAQSTTVLKVVRQGAESNSLALPVVAALPGIFTMNLSGHGQGAVLNQDLSVNSPGNPAARGSTVMIYATGGGPLVSPVADGAVAQGAIGAVLPVTARIDGGPAEVRYAGSAPGLVGSVMQVNVVVPGDANPAADAAVQIAVNGITSQFGVTLAVR